MTKKYKSSGVTPEEFIKVWQTSKTLDEVAERTGIEKNAAAAKASGYRKKRVPLKRFKEPLDWERLAELAKEIKEAQ